MQFKISYMHTTFQPVGLLQIWYRLCPFFHPLIISVSLNLSLPLCLHIHIALNETVLQYTYLMDMETTRRLLFWTASIPPPWPSWRYAHVYTVTCTFVYTYDHVIVYTLRKKDKYMSIYIRTCMYMYTCTIQEECTLCLKYYSCAPYAVCVYHIHVRTCT